MSNSVNWFVLQEEYSIGSAFIGEKRVFVTEECVRCEPSIISLYETFTEAICGIANVEWENRTHWDYDDVENFVGIMADAVRYFGNDAKWYPITTVKELRELKELLCWDAFAPSFDYRDKKNMGDRQIETPDLECYEMCVRVCSHELREEYLKVHGCICGACSKNCKCYKDKECDAPDEE
jgi:hypothetical protein